MRLLILTQKIDLDAGVLGFFHNWVEKMADKFQTLEVVCLFQGATQFPKNVRVWSLGKDQGAGRLKYTLNFYKYIWRLRNDYDAVFVHMNKEYIILGGLFWRLLGKKIILWHNHRRGGILAKIAYFLTNRVFFTSSFSFFAGSDKSKQMPVGIDTDLFKAEASIKKTNNSILYLGRIAPIKNTEVIIEAAKLLSQDNNRLVLNIVGDALARDQSYFEKIKFSAKELEATGLIKFMGEVSNHKSPKVYNQNEIFVNLTNSGSLDKTILEAMACELLVIVSNQHFKNILPTQFIFEENRADDLKNKLTQVLKLPEDQKKEIGKKFREYVIKNHSLDLLITQLHTIFEKN